MPAQASQFHITRVECNSISVTSRYRVTGKLFAMKRFMKNENSQRVDNALQATFEMKRCVRK